MSWLGCEGLKFVQTLNSEEEEKCKTSSGLFEVLNDKFKPEHNKQYYHYNIFKLTREQNENVGELME